MKRLPDMQLKHKHLLNLLQENNYEIRTHDLQIDQSLIADLEKWAPLQLYKELGGIQEDCPHYTRTWFIVEPNIVVFLDDYLHFNRYRNITLRSELYDHLPGFQLENYRRYCRNYEKECIKSGLQKWVWANRESDFYFGSSEEPGDFSKRGSGGWKLRAFQDYIEDAASLVLQYKLIRFSVYDNFLAEGKLVRLDSILDRAVHPLQKQLLKYVTRRIHE